MSTNFEITLEAARSLANQLAKDIQLATTRNDHLRTTARANEALIIYNLLLAENQQSSSS